MSYLSKVDRKEQILKAAIDITLTNGLHALTARSVSSYANMALGQVYHHFGSISDLRSEVFARISNGYLQESQKIDLEPFELISFMLTPTGETDTNAYLKLWRDAEKILDGDEKLALAYNKTIITWHEILEKAIDDGVASCDFSLKNGTASDVAWRLIAISFGLEKLGGVCSQQLSADVVNAYINTCIRNELTKIN